MRLLRVFGALAVLAFGFPLVVRAADVGGTWNTEFDTQVGPQKYTFDFKVADGQLTGTASFERMGQTGQAELKEGKLEGDKISFVELLEIQGSSIRIEYTGQVKGDEIAFTRNVGDFASEQFVARRVKN